MYIAVEPSDVYCNMHCIYLKYVILCSDTSNCGLEIVIVAIPIVRSCNMLLNSCFTLRRTLQCTCGCELVAPSWDIKCAAKIPPCHS